jgi:hypothetical protein
MWQSVLPAVSDEATAQSASVATPDQQTLHEPNAPASRTQRRLANVRYQLQPNGEQRCGLCSRFSAASDSCIPLNEPISSEGWCVLWGRKN